MSVKYGFYNSVANDRQYNAEDMSSIFTGIITDGVFQNIGTALIVAVNSGMVVNIGIGRCWFNNTWTNNDAIYPIALDTAEVVLNRIDSVVIEIDGSLRINSFKIIQGTPATTPVAPTLTNAGLIHQYALANIYVGAGVSEIIAANITNKVGTESCPFITGILQTLDASALLAQWDSEFETWLATLANALDGDTAGNLLNLINEIKTTTISLLMSPDVQGKQIVAGMAASCAVYDLLYHAATGFNKAQANSATTCPVVGMCMETGAGSKKVLLNGVLYYTGWAWTIGGLIYLSASVAGGMTQTKPSASGQQVQIVGFAISTKVMYFNPDYTFVEV
jgi:hypothetical protein